MSGRSQAADRSVRGAVVHERFTELGGSEAVAAELAALLPDALVHAPFARHDGIPDGLAWERLRVGPLQGLVRGTTYAHLLPLLPWAFGRMDLGDAELVLVSHHAFASRVRRPAGAAVVAYVHTPARWLWDAALRRGEGGRAGAAALGGFAVTQRAADRRAGQRLDARIANSTEVADRIQRWWGCESDVVHPPVDTDFFRPDPSVEREDFVLVAGRLVPYKQADVAVAAAARAGVRVVVAGDGRALEACRRVAGPGAEFLGRVSDAELRSLFQRCRALVMPGFEDFGIVPVEAAACGAPVVALGRGGALDSVRDGTTGVLVPPGPDGGPGVDAFAEVLRDARLDRIDPDACRAQAESFSPAAFRAGVAAVVARATGITLPLPHPQRSDRQQEVG